MRMSVRLLKRLLREAASSYEREYFGDELADLVDDPELVTPYDRYHNVEYGINRSVTSIEAIRKNVKAFKDVVPYADGAFRTLFEIPGNDNLLLKVAFIDEEDVYLPPTEVNRLEVNLFNKYPDFFPKVFMYHPKYHWYVVEKIHVVDDADDFIDLFRDNFKFASYENFKSFITYILIHTGIRKETLSMLISDKNTYNILADLITSLLSDLEHEKTGLTKILKDNIYEIIQQALTDMSFVLVRDNNMSEEKKIANYKRKIIDDSDVCMGQIDFLYVKMTSDTKFRKFIKMIIDEDLSSSDFRALNVGTNSSGDFLIIDAFR